MATRAKPTAPRRVVSRRTAPASPATAAKTGEGSNGPDLETFHYHKGCIERAQAAVAMNRKTLKTERRRASDAGINLADLDLIMKMAEEEPETVQARIRRVAEYAKWAGLAPGVQGDLFVAADETADALKVADHEGYVEGLEGKTAEGDRYDASSEVGQARLKGHARGQSILLDRFVAKQAPEQTEAPETIQ